jgi:hypothetical protein
VTLLVREAGVGIWIEGFSPNGDRVFFTKSVNEGTGGSSLWSVGVDGSDPRRIVAIDARVWLDVFTETPEG